MLKTLAFQLVRIFVGTIILMITALRSIYFTFFELYLSYCSFVLVQYFSNIYRIVTLQKEAVIIITFQPRDSHTKLLLIPIPTCEN